MRPWTMPISSDSATCSTRWCRETDTRYLVVTHNAVSMARMHRLFGVTMVERGVSRLVSVDLGGAETLARSGE